MKYVFLSFLICASYFQVSAQTCVINVTYSSFPPAHQTAFEYAASIWESKLVSSVPIKINAIYITYPGGPLAITFSNGRKDFAGAIHDSTWYPTTLANSLAGIELNTGEYDIDMYVNGAPAWYTGTDGNTPAGQYDFVSVILHEIGHGLGFTSLTKKDSTTGSFGFLEMSDFAPVSTSYPWPDLDSLPGIFDRFIENNVGTDVISLPNPSSTLGTYLTSGQLFFNGPLTVAANSGSRARLYAPGAFTLGTSVLHLNEATYPVGHAEELMTPFVSSGNSHHEIGPMTIAMLEDMGWNINVGINEFKNTNFEFDVYPNPVIDHFFVYNAGTTKKQLQIINSIGELINTSEFSEDHLRVNCSQFPSGHYIIVLKNQFQITTGSFIKL